MKHTNLQILIILLIASLLAAKCDCGNNPKSGKKQEPEQEQEYNRIDMDKQVEFLMKKLGLDELDKLKEKRKYSPKPKKKVKPVGNNPVAQQQKEQKKQQELTQLVQEEKDLVSKADVALDQFEKDIKSLQPEDEFSEFGEGSSGLPVPIDREFMKDLIKACKDDPEFTKESLDSLQKVQKALNKFQQKLPTLRDKKPSIKEFFNVLLDSAGINIEEAKELFGPELFNREEVQEAEQMLSEPVIPDQLPPHIYNKIVNKYPFASKNKWNFCCALAEEFLPNIKKVVDTHLDIIENMKKQNDLEEWE